MPGPARSPCRRKTRSAASRSKPTNPNVKSRPVSRTHFHFFGGKGGVGKTTCAAACALVEARAGRRTLIVSTDPAHSLGDALGLRLSAAVTKVPVGAALAAVELDAPRAFARWLREHRRALSDIVEHGTWLDDEDVENLLALPIPGIDELLGLLEIVRLAGVSGPGRESRGLRAGNYDRVVVDTAPIGHTLRLLAAPATVTAIATVLDELQQQHRLIKEQLARIQRPEAADRLIALLAEQARETGELLRDAERTTFHWVTLAEDLSVAESEHSLGALETARIRVPEVIVNRVIPNGPPCPLCDRRRSDERRMIARIRRTFGKPRHVRIVPAELREPHGVAALARIGAHLSGRRVGPPLEEGLKRRAPRHRPASRSSAPSANLEIFQGTRLLLFGGKGGVGKTTIASAVSIRLARAEPDRRLLLLSTDPVPSLGDAFGTPIGQHSNEGAGAPPNLHVRQLDASAALAAWRAELTAAIDEIVGAFGADVAATAGGRGLSELMELAPPGIDELFALVSVMELLSAPHARSDSAGSNAQPRVGNVAGPRKTAAAVRAPQYDTIVVDTAPTGHTLRFLEMPDAAREWVQVLLRVLLKYRKLVQPGRLAENLVEISRSIRALRELLRNPGRTRFIVVTRAALVPRLETMRLLTALRRLRLAVPAVIVNGMTLTPGRCPRCRATATAEKRELNLLVDRCRRVGRGCVIIQAPLAAPPPRGAAALEAWANTWIDARR